MRAGIAAVAGRNVEVHPTTPMASWPYEALVAAIERGSLRDWARISAEIGREPWGAVARAVEEYLGYEQPAGVAPLLRRAVDRSRRQAEERERSAVAARVADLVASSGLSMADFAARAGTSRSRLSTYRSGRVTPSAALMVRMERLAARAAAEGRG